MGGKIRTSAFTDSKLKLRIYFPSSVIPQDHTNVNFIEEYFHFI
jgi:hypothetical protein